MTTAKAEHSALPYATILLIVANIGVAFATVWNPSLPSVYGHRPDQFWLPALFTSLFVHANTFHLLGNMVFLAAVGASVELGAGRGRYLLVYFLSGLAGILTYHLVAVRATDPLPLVGASGCIAGCAAYFSVRYLRLRVPLAPNRSAPVAVITAIWAVLQVAGAFIQLGGESTGTAYFAHLGGLAMGLLLAAVMRAPDLAELRFGHDVLDRMNERGPAAALEAAQRHLEKHPGDPKALAQVVQAHAQLGHPKEEAFALLELAQACLEGERPACFQRVCELGEAGLIPSQRRVRIAESLVATSPQAARMLLQSIVDGAPTDPEWPNAIVALVGIERETEPSRAAILIQSLVDHDPLHPLVEVVRKRGWVS